MKLGPPTDSTNTTNFVVFTRVFVLFLCLAVVVSATPDPFQKQVIAKRVDGMPVSTTEVLAARHTDL